MTSLKLGIVCVYLVDRDDEPLLDLHLRQIRRHTDVPYTIYGSANRLSPELRRKLEGSPAVRLCDPPSTGLRGYEEHAYYLDRLIPLAAADGCSHLVLLNVDSFPVRPGWAREMIDSLSRDRVVVAVKRLENHDDKPHPCGLLFAREFYLRHRPTLLATPEERASAAFERYLEATEVIDDTGIGFGFKLFAEGLGWRPLLRSNRGEDHYILGSVYGDLIFHLGGASREAKIHLRERRRIDAGRERTWAHRLVLHLARRAAVRVPPAIRRAVRPHLRLPGTRRSLRESQRAYDTVRDRLLADPEAYLRYLRLGPPADPAASVAEERGEGSPGERSP